jgi:hypothetical protein
MMTCPLLPIVAMVAGFAVTPNPNPRVIGFATIEIEIAVRWVGGVRLTWTGLEKP